MKDELIGQLGRPAGTGTVCASATYVSRRQITHNAEPLRCEGLVASGTRVRFTTQDITRLNEAVEPAAQFVPEHYLIRSEIRFGVGFAKGSIDSPGGFGGQVDLVGRR